MKGSYILLIKLPAEQVLTVGRLQDIRFHSGYYAYVGSAMNGVKSRLSHHLRQDKKPHWHIDYLLQRASIIDIGICQAENRVECEIARALGSQFDSIPGFGSSDCRCQSHLFFTPDGKQMKGAIRAVLASMAKPSPCRECAERLND